MVGKFRDRAGAWKRAESAASEIANTILMLERFARLENGGPTPFAMFGRPQIANIFGHDVSMDYDLIYKTSNGLVLRQLITDNEIRRTEHLKQYAAATLAHHAALAPDDLVNRIEIWHLRYDTRVLRWPVEVLQGRAAAGVAERIAEVVALLNDQVA